MKEQPTLTTERLILRPFSLADAKELQKLIGDRTIADTMISIPHPYTDKMAKDWIGKRTEQYEEGKSIQFAITNKENGSLIGGIGMNINMAHKNAEVGYWIAKPCWHRGYCTEAASATVRYGFEMLGLNRICAKHMTRNPRSGRVMQKIGMKHEGHMRQAWEKWGKFEDYELYAILRSDFPNTNSFKC